MTAVNRRRGFIPTLMIHDEGQTEELSVQFEKQDALENLNDDIVDIPIPRGGSSTIQDEMFETVTDPRPTGESHVNDFIQSKTVPTVELLENVQVSDSVRTFALGHAYYMFEKNKFYPVF